MRARWWIVPLAELEKPQKGVAERRGQEPPARDGGAMAPFDHPGWKIFSVASLVSGKVQDPLRPC